LTFRVALLLAVITLVGFAGLNGDVRPGYITSVHAATVDIEVTGSGPGNSLGFTIGSAGCPDALLGSESCTAQVTVTNLGDDPVTLSSPTASESGALETCTGDDPDSPGGGGNNLSTSIQNLSYTPNSTVLDNGETATFTVTVLLSAAAPNACQGKTGTVTVRVTATGPDETPTPTPIDVVVITPTPEPTRQAQVLAATPTATPRASFTAEVLPAQLPATGQAGDPVRRTAELLLLGTGLSAAALFLLTLAMRRKTEEDA
jgi:hypothetical protein